MPNYIKVKTGSSSWSTATKAYVKKSTGWVEPIRIWMNLLSGWTRIWPISGPFALTSPYIVSTASGSTHLMPTSPIRVGTIYYGRNGTWDANGWTISSYSYQWRKYSLQSAADDTGQTNRSSGTFASPSIPYTPTSADDKKYLSFYIKPNTTDTFEMSEAESGDDDGRLFAITQIPLNTSVSLTATSQVETVITLSSSWDTSDARQIETPRTKVAWYKNTIASFTGATPIKNNLSSVAGAYSYTPGIADQNNYIIARETAFNSGSDYSDGVLTLANTVGSGTEVGVTAQAISGLVTSALIAPTSTSISSVSRLTDTTIRAIINSSGGSGPYYQLFWQSGNTAPSTTSYDAASITSTVTEDFSFGSGLTYYFYIRSSSENLGNTTTNGTGTSGTYSAYGPSTGAASYSFAQASGSPSITGNTTVGSILTLTTSPSGSPSAQVNSIIWRRADGGAGGSSFTSGSVLQTGGTSYTIDSPIVAYSSVGYAIRAEVVYNNGLGVNAAIGSNSLVVTSIIPTITMAANSGITQTSGTINWSSTNQASFSSSGTISGSGTTATSVTNNSLSPGTTYTGTVTVTSSTGNTASANYSLTTSTGSVLTPTFGTNTSTSTGFTGSVTNYNSAYNWNTPSNGSFTLTNGTWTWGVASGATRPFTVTGLSASQSSTATVTTTRTGYTSGSASTTGTASALAQYTVTWNANGGTGGGSTIQNAGVAHTAPSVTRSGYTLNGYFDTQSGASSYGPVAVGGSFTPPSTITMYARWTIIPVTPNISSITVTGNVTAGVTCSAVMTNTLSVEYVLYCRDTTASAWVQKAAGTASANGTSLTSAISTILSQGTLPDQYYVTMTPYTGTRSISGTGGGTGTAGTQRSTLTSPKNNASGSITVNY